MFSKRGFVVVVAVAMLLQIVEAGVLGDMIQKRLEASAESAPKKPNTIMDVAYGSDKKQRFDVYLPQNPKNAPVIVMVHGGAWSKGDKRTDRVVENKAARWNPKGIIFVSVNYRLLPDADPLQQADDVANALIYIQNHAYEWGGDTSKIVLMGHSAGAHLVSLVSADPSRYNRLKPWLCTVSLDSAAMNIVSLMGRKHYNFYDEAFGNDPMFWEAASPYHRLKTNAVPMMLVCSSTRNDKPCDEIQGFMHKAKSLGNRIEVQSQAMSHKEINEDLGLESDYTNVVEMFIRSMGVAI